MSFRRRVNIRIDLDKRPAVAAIAALAARLRARREPDWVNPVTGHGADCGCLPCYLSQNQ